MKEKIQLSYSEKKEIFDKFKSGISMRKLENEYPYSFSFIQKLIKSFEFDNQINENYPLKEGYDLVAECKITKKQISDYRNQSGAITSHIETIYKIEIPSNYKRKSQEYETGKFWYDQYFNFIYVETKQTKKCKYCDWTTEDINNNSGAYEKHLKTAHNKELCDYIKEFPDDKDYFGKDIYDELIECKICGKKFKTITNTHLMNVHSITQFEYKMKYGLKITSSETSEKLSIIGKEANKHMLISKTSLAENNIKNILESNNIDVIQSTRKNLNGLEIDLLIPDKKIGIEYNGNYYHTELRGGKLSNYHINKTKDARKKDIILYHIFEDEWHYKNSIVINKLKHILKINEDNKILHARKCEITENISRTEKSVFLDKNHIQGNDKSTVVVSAKYGDEIVAVMTFNNKRVMNREKLHNSNTYELTRLAVKNNYVINGIASRLLKYFINAYKPEKIISFADRRWTPDSENNLYVKLGFTLTKILNPDYTYFNSKLDRLKRFHKFAFGKSSIKRKYPEIYDDNKTEWEMMQELGFDRIWDCGKLKYELIISK